MCLAPSPDFQRVLEGVGELRLKTRPFGNERFSSEGGVAIVIVDFRFWRNRDLERNRRDVRFQKMATQVIASDMRRKAVIHGSAYGSLLRIRF